MLRSSGGVSCDEVYVSFAGVVRQGAVGADSPGIFWCDGVVGVCCLPRFYA